MDIETGRKLAMAFEGTEEKDHFGRPSFRVNNKIFSTLHVSKGLMMVKLPLIEQSVFNAFDPTIFYPVPNKWGLGGATFIDLSKVREDMLIDALTISWEGAKAKRKLKNPKLQ